MSDGGLRQLFRDHLKAGWHWQSIETVLVSTGVPDSNGCCGGVEVWVEFKQTSGWAVTLRPDQIGWLVARSYRGGRCFVAVRRWTAAGPRKPAADELWLLDGARARELKTGGLRANVGVLGVWRGGPSAWDWAAVQSLLVAPRGTGHHRL